MWNSAPDPEHGMGAAKHARPQAVPFEPESHAASPSALLIVSLAAAAYLLCCTPGWRHWPLVKKFTSFLPSRPRPASTAAGVDEGKQVKPGKPNPAVVDALWLTTGVPANQPGGPGSMAATARPARKGASAAVPHAADKTIPQSQASGAQADACSQRGAEDKGSTVAHSKARKKRKARPVAAAHQESTAPSLTEQTARVDLKAMEPGWQQSTLQGLLQVKQGEGNPIASHDLHLNAPLHNVYDINMSPKCLLEASDEVTGCGLLSTTTSHICSPISTAQDTRVMYSASSREDPAAATPHSIKRSDSEDIASALNSPFHGAPVMTATPDPAQVQTQQQQLYTCAWCGYQGNTLLACGACGQVCYCDVSCQRAHWRKHKKACAVVQAELIGNA